MSVKLTQGAIEALMNGSVVDNPVLQLLKISELSNRSGPSRHRLMISDSQHFSTSFLLATQLNCLCSENLLQPYCVCRLKKTTTSSLSNGRTVVIVLDIDIMKTAEEIGGKIGNPILYKKEGEKSSSQDIASTRTSAPVSPLPAAAPGPSYQNNSRSFSPPRDSERGFVGKSPMKGSSMKASPTQFSPMKASPNQFSPMKDSSVNASPMKASPTQFLPMKASPTQFSPMKASPTQFSPMKASPTQLSPMKASPTEFSPMKASPMKASPTQFSPSKASPMKASPSKFSPMKANSSSPGSSTQVIPIANLNPYQSKWTVRARVTNKSNIRNWNNSRGEGKLFSFEIIDESGEMKITAFNNEADKFFPLMEQGKVYYISKGTLKVANKQYNTLKNDYEMTLNSYSSIVPCDDSEDVPAMHCDFVPIAELEKRDPDAIVDVIGVCKSVEDVSRVVTRTGREVSKRTLNLIDTTGKEVAATLWGEEAEKFDGSGQPVIAINGARLSDFRGRSLSILFSSRVMVNPDIPEAYRVRVWYDQEGHRLNSQSLSETSSAGSGTKTNWKTLSDIKSEQLGHREKADYFCCVAAIVYIRKENCLYQACPSATCNKKVIELQTGRYRCEKCDREFDNFKYRLLLSANLADFGDNQWVTCFQETAEVLLGQSAESLGRLRETDEAAFDEVFHNASYRTHIFKNRVKLETYNDECRVKVTVMEVQPIDHREYSQRLLSDIRRLAS